MPVANLDDYVLRLREGDDVGVLKKTVKAGTQLEDGSLKITASETISGGHKISLQKVADGDPVRKYGQIVGFAEGSIEQGDHVHTHNLVCKDYDRKHAFTADYRATEFYPEADQGTFMGFARPGGRAATRNYVAVISNVNCSNSVSRYVAERFCGEDFKRQYPNVDGVAAFSHHTGCGMEMTGEPMNLLHWTLAGYIQHSNVAASLVVGLGCERCQVGGLFAAQRLVPGETLRTLVMQENGGTRQTIAEGVAIVKELLETANQCQRQTVPASHIMVGLQCGGSDGFSSITANPALGKAVDILSRHGGTGILSETPEIYGVEHTLTARAATVEIGKKLIERIRWWKEEYAVGRDVQINGVVSPGNQKGGLANILEKSLGSSMKGGTGPLMAVYHYGEPVTTNGFVFMDSPGFDPVSATGQIAGGANMVAFTTGRGSCFGAKPSPSIKLATNTPMFQRMEEDMDINCGAILDGETNMDQMGQRIFEYFLYVASGGQTKSEALDLGRHEFIPWNIGITG